MRDAREGPHPRKAELERANRVPPMARGRACSRTTGSPRLPRRDSRAVPPGPPVPGDETTRRVDRVGPRRTRNGNDPPERHPPPARRRVPPLRDGEVRRGSKTGRERALTLASESASSRELG